MFISTVFEGSMIDSKWITNGTEKEIKATVEYKCIKLIETKEKLLESKKFLKKVWPLNIKVSRISKFLIKRDCAYILALASVRLWKLKDGGS
jgi:hypothetical protein